MCHIVKLSIVSAITLVMILITVVFMIACNNGSQGENASLNTGTGINFSDKGLKLVAAKSKQENKPVFLLVHASYCSSCKKMKQLVFPDKEIGDLFNKSFINAHVDIESEEGKMIVKDYEITGTPTLLFLAPDGEVINKSSGFHSKEELIALTKGLSVNGNPVCE